MPLGVGSGFWAIALPVQKDNLLLNPSFEYGTTGAAAIQSSTLGSSSQFQQFGAWSLQVTPNSNGTSGAALGTWTATNGAAYTVSAYVRGANGVPYMIGVGDSSGLNLVGSTAFTGGGTWQRYSYSFTEASGAVRRVVIRKTSGVDVTAFYVDGQVAEAGSITTYVDGDADGCVWNGAPHASTSTRSGQSRAGGSLVALADLGWNVDQMIGVGMPPMENSSQSYAVVDGAQYQRTRVAARAFTLTAKPIVGTSLADFHQTRNTIINAIKIGAFDPQQPSRFYYVGGMGTVQIDALYDSGLELGNMDGPIAEDIAVKFVAYQPYWTAPTQEGTTLAAYNTFGSANFVVSRDPIGRWGTLGPSGTSTSGEVRSLTIGTDQRVLVGGSYRTAGGTASGNLALYDPPSNTWGSFAGGTITAGFVYDTAIFPNGTILIVGSFQNIGGTNARNIGYWAGANFGSYGGTADSAVNVVSINATGTAFIGGEFSTMGGTVAPFLATLINNALGSIIGQAGGTVNSSVITTTIGLDQSLYFGGAFSKAGGTSAGGVARWRAGSFGTMGSGITSFGVNTMTTMLDGRIAIGGQFSSISGVVTPNVAAWNGAGMQALAQGFSQVANSALLASMVDQNNTLYVAGHGSYAGSVVLPDGIAKYVGGAWVPLDITLGPSLGIFAPDSIVYAMTQSPSGTLYFGGDFAGSAIYATVAQLVNRGGAPAFPTLRLRNISSGTVRVFDMTNPTTGDAIYFNLTMQSGEVAWLDLTPTARSFTSSFRGNVFGAIIPGSNLATWSLLPGTNYVGFFADNAGLETSIFWTPSSYSADSGTVY